MAEVIPFKSARTSSARRGNSLCRSGHHRWEVVKQTAFDVKQGRLVSRYQCSRCGKTRVKAD